MEEKSVLVSFSGKKKVLRIHSTEKSSDVSLLSKEFKNTFFDCEEDSSSIAVTFQKFDRDWDEYVDLESWSTINNKEKLNAVVEKVVVIM